MNDRITNRCVRYLGIVIAIVVPLAILLWINQNAVLAFEREPDHWVMPYNLGMIEDRLEMFGQVTEHLQTALAVGIPEGRHRLLVQLWLSRAAARTGQPEAFEEALAALKREKRGLSEWRTIFESEQAATLRAVLEKDVTTAQKLADGAGMEVFNQLGALTEVES